MHFTSWISTGRYFKQKKSKQTNKQKTQPKINQTTKNQKKQKPKHLFYYIPLHSTFGMLLYNASLFVCQEFIHIQFQSIFDRFFQLALILRYLRDNLQIRNTSVFWWSASIQSESIAISYTVQQKSWTAEEIQMMIQIWFCEVSVIV